MLCLQVCGIPITEVKLCTIESMMRSREPLLSTIFRNMIPASDEQFQKCDGQWIFLFHEQMLDSEFAQEPR